MDEKKKVVTEVKGQIGTSDTQRLKSMVYRFKLVHKTPSSIISETYYGGYRLKV